MLYRCFTAFSLCEFIDIHRRSNTGIDRSPPPNQVAFHDVQPLGHACSGSRGFCRIHDVRRLEFDQDGRLPLANTLSVDIRIDSSKCLPLFLGKRRRVYVNPPNPYSMALAKSR